MRVRTFAASVYGGGLFYVGTTSQVFLMALLLQIGFGLSAFHAGLMLLASATGSTVMRFTFRPILKVLGFRRMLICNAILMGACFAACGLFTDKTPIAVIVAVLFVSGFARSIQFTGVQSLGYADIPPPQLSQANTLSVTAQQLTQSLGVGLVALAVHLSTVLHGHTAIRADDVAPAFFVIGLLAASSAIIFYRLPVGAGSALTGR